MGSSSKHSKKDKHSKKSKDKKRSRNDSDSDPEEAARRVIRRLEKEHKQRQIAPLQVDDAELDNAFGDKNISEKFFWKKKVEKDVKSGRDVASFTSQGSAVKDRERAVELERVKERR